MTNFRYGLFWLAAACLVFAGLVAIPTMLVDALIPSPPPAPDPHQFARELSGLTIPTTARVDRLYWDPSGPTLAARVELTVSQPEIAQLAGEARAKGYRDVVGAPRRDQRHLDSVDSLGRSPYGAWEAAEELPVGSRGLYRYEDTPPSRSLVVVLDSLRGRFVAELHTPYP